MFKAILCPIDGSETSLSALEAAAQLAAEQQASLTICTVVNPSKASAMAFGDPAMSAACFDALDEEGKTMVADAVAGMKGVVNAQAVCLDGQTTECIVDYADSHGIDLIVMGSHGRSGLPRALMGSVAEGVVRHASVPVLIVRSHRHPAADGSRARPAAAATGE